MRRRVEAGSNAAGAGSSPRSKVSLLVALGVALTAAIVFFSSLAAAEELPVSQFGGPGSAAGQLSDPGGVAVDPTSGDIYVADTANYRIDEFVAESGFVRFERAWGWGVADGTSELQTCTNECQSGQGGQGAGQLNEPVGVAVAPDGDVYALNRAKNDGRVQRFDTSGEDVALAGAFGGYDETGTEAAKFSYPLHQGNDLAIGAGGKVYVADSGKSRVAVFDNTGKFESEIAGEAAAVAVAPSGTIYVAGESGGTSVYEADGTFKGQIATELFTPNLALAVNPANENLVIEVATGYEASTKYQLEEFTEAGLKVGTYPVPGMTPPATYEDPRSFGLAFSTTASFPESKAGAVFVSDREGSKVHILAEPELGAPQVSGVGANGIGSDAANLAATINPRGSDTHFYFKYGTTAAYGSTSPTPPGQDIGGGYAPEPVGTHLVGLAPSTTYHYALIAENAEGTSESGDGVFTTFATSSPQVLPDNRAWEQVSTEKGINDVAAEGIAAPAGNGVSFTAVNGLPGSPSGILITGYAAQRGANGWSTKAASPPEENLTTLATGPPLLFSPDLGQTVAPSNRDLTGNAPPGVANLYLRTNATGAEQLMTPNVPVVHLEYSTFTIVGASADFKHIVFKSNAALTPDSPPVETQQLYAFSNGELHNIGILPGQTTPTESGFPEFSSLNPPHPISEDGSRVFFTTQAEPAVPGELTANQVFLRTDNAATIEVSASQATTRDPQAAEQPATFVGAAADGSSAFFTSIAKLTDDADTGATGDLAPNLYRYDVASGELADLTVAGEPEDEELGANVNGGVLVAGDGTSAYFVALANLAAGGTSGQPNLYHWTRGRPVEFVAGLNESDSLSAPYESAAGRGRTTADGSTLPFTSVNALDPAHPDVAGTKEIYRYSAADGSIACVSCGSLGSAPAEAAIAPPLFVGGAGGNILSADGSRVFFQTPAALVPQDTNGKLDTYEWENGSVHLISSGSGNSESKLLDASASGDDVFFSTRDRLAPGDTDSNIDIYDARVNGGLPAPPAVTPPCEAEACRPPLEAAPPPPQVGSRSFNGPHDKKPKHHKHKKHRKKHAKKCKRGAKKCAKKPSKRSTAGKRG